MKPKVCLVSVTPDAEKTIGYIARVSNPANQDNPKVAGLLKYCIQHGHWSVFEQATMTLQIETTRGLGAQILRHRSFCFQEFSQRYADSSALGDIQLPELRRQDTKNRQNSIDDLDPFVVQKFEILMQNHFKQGMELYQQMLEEGIARGETSSSLRIDPLDWQQRVLQQDYALFEGLPADQRLFTDTSFVEDIVFASRAGIRMGPGVQSWLQTKRYSTMTT